MIDLIHIRNISNFFEHYDEREFRERFRLSMVSECRVLTNVEEALEYRVATKLRSSDLAVANAKLFNTDIVGMVQRTTHNNSLIRAQFENDVNDGAGHYLLGDN